MRNLVAFGSLRHSLPPSPRFAYVSWAPKLPLWLKKQIPRISLAQQLPEIKYLAKLAKLADITTQLLGCDSLCSIGIQLCIDVY